jgi:hypothetical protein
MMSSFFRVAVPRILQLDASEPCFLMDATASELLRIVKRDNRYYHDRESIDYKPECDALSRTLLKSPTVKTLESVAGSPHLHGTFPAYVDLDKNLPSMEGMPKIFFNIIGEDLLDIMCIKTLVTIANPQVLVTWGALDGTPHQDEFNLPTLAQLHNGVKLWRFWSPWEECPMQTVDTNSEVDKLVDGNPHCLNPTRVPDYVFLQKVGDIVYVPPGWYHAVRTLTRSAVMVGVYVPVKDLESIYNATLVSHRLTAELSTNGNYEIAATHEVYKDFVENPLPAYTFNYLSALKGKEAYLKDTYPSRERLRHFLKQTQMEASSRQLIGQKRRDKMGRKSRKKLCLPKKGIRNKGA